MMMSSCKIFHCSIHPFYSHNSFVQRGTSIPWCETHKTDIIITPEACIVAHLLEISAKVEKLLKESKNARNP
jgi:hypothetical protein